MTTPIVSEMACKQQLCRSVWADFQAAERSLDRDVLIPLDI
jgi:hypothetical protein